METLDGVEVEHVSDRTFLLHLGGKLEVKPKTPIKTRDNLSMAYTPGVARVCEAIAEDPTKVWNLTVKRNAVAIVSDGTAVLGLGDIGPGAALPVMEGKAMLFKEFAGVNAWPLCLGTTDPERIVSTVAAIAPVFGGINLEDISAPRCFEIERRLDDPGNPGLPRRSHGTAIVVLAALLNALRVVDKTLNDVRVVITGVGAAGVATTNILLAAGVRDVVGCDLGGVCTRASRSRQRESRVRAAHQSAANRGYRGRRARRRGRVHRAIGTGGCVARRRCARWRRTRSCSQWPTPLPEVIPEEVQGVAAVIATGRSDYPNQINNVLAFPGVFRGALDVGAPSITSEMKFAAARAIASVIPDDQLDPDYIIPSVFNPEVAPAVAAAIVQTAEREGMTRKLHATDA